MASPGWEKPAPALVPGAHSQASSPEGGGGGASGGRKVEGSSQGRSLIGSEKDSKPAWGEEGLMALFKNGTEAAGKADAAGPTGSVAKVETGQRMGKRV